MSGFVPKKVSNARMRTKTNQTGLKMSGTATMLGRRGYIQRYVNRRVQPNVGVCGYPHGYRCINGVEPIFDSTGALLNPEAVRQNCKLVVNGINGINCVDAAPKNQGLAGGVGRINAPRFGCNISCSTGLPNPYSRKSKIPVENVFYYPSVDNTFTIPWFTGTSAGGISPGVSQRIYTLLFYINNNLIAPSQEAKSIISITTTLNNDQKKYWNLDQNINRVSKHPGQLTLLQQNSSTFPSATAGLEGSFKISVTYKPYDELAKDPPKTKTFVINYKIKEQPIPQPTPGGGDGIYDIMYTNATDSEVSLQDFWTNAFINPDTGGSFAHTSADRWKNKKLAIAPQIYSTQTPGGGNPAANMKTDATSLVPSAFSEIELWFRPEADDIPSTTFSVCDSNFLSNVSSALVTSNYISNINATPAAGGLTGMIFTQETQNKCTGSGKTEGTGQSPMSGLVGGYSWQSNIIFQGKTTKSPDWYNNFVAAAPQVYETDLTNLVTGIGSAKPDICNVSNAQNFYVSYKQAIGQQQNYGWKIDSTGTTILNTFGGEESKKFEEYIQRTVVHILEHWQTQPWALNAAPNTLVPVFAFGSVGSNADVSFDAEGAAYFLYCFETLTDPTNDGIFKQFNNKIKYIMIYNAGKNDDNKNNYGSYLSKSPCNTFNTQNPRAKSFWNAWGNGGSGGNIALGQ